jgi:hypothetical protein
MALLKIHPNSVLQELYQEALSRGASAQEMLDNFGKPPFHFLGPRTGPVRRYNDFEPKYVDREGREYSPLEDDDKMGVRIPIAVRRKNPMIQFPQPGETVHILKLTSQRVLELYVVSLHVNKTRTSTAWLEISK